MRSFLALSLVISMAACSDDASVTSDSGVAKEASADIAAPDKSMGKEASTPDQSSQDQGSPDQASGPKVLASGHKGWGKVNCSTCHSPWPPKNHTQTKAHECASCHGGNGACSLPSGHMSSGCTGCHTGSKIPTSHAIFSSASECKACHMASAGTTKCP